MLTNRKLHAKQKSVYTKRQNLVVLTPREQQRLHTAKPASLWEIPQILGVQAVQELQGRQPAIAIAFPGWPHYS